LFIHRLPDVKENPKLGFGKFDTGVACRLRVSSGWSLANNGGRRDDRRVEVVRVAAEV
jgi:hypothetical protein